MTGFDRAASRVSREVCSRGGRPAYGAHVTDGQAWDSALRPKKCLLALHPRLRNIVASKLILDWSPEQISGWRKTQYPDDESLRVSNKTIYRSLFIQAHFLARRPILTAISSSSFRPFSSILARIGRNFDRYGTPFPLENASPTSVLAALHNYIH